MILDHLLVWLVLIADRYCYPSFSVVYDQPFDCPKKICGQLLPKVFPVYDEEAELELDSSCGTDDHSPRVLHTQDSGEIK